MNFLKSLYIQCFLCYRGNTVPKTLQRYATDNSCFQFQVQEAHLIFACKKLKKLSCLQGLGLDRSEDLNAQRNNIFIKNQSNFLIH